jgi:hypothetical protein
LRERGCNKGGVKGYGREPENALQPRQERGLNILLVFNAFTESLSYETMYHILLRVEEKMADMKCKYCGQKFSAGGFCSQSPSKKHQLAE